MKQRKQIMKRIFDSLKIMYNNTLTHKEASEEDYQALLDINRALYDLQKLMDRKLAREKEKSSIEIPYLKELPFDGEVIIAIAVYQNYKDYYHVIPLWADDKTSAIFDIEWRECSFDETLAELGEELPKKSGVYRLSCTANLETEPGEFGTVLSRYPYLTINSAVPIWSSAEGDKNES